MDKGEKSAELKFEFNAPQGGCIQDMALEEQSFSELFNSRFRAQFTDTMQRRTRPGRRPSSWPSAAAESPSSTLPRSTSG